MDKKIKRMILIASLLSVLIIAISFSIYLFLPNLNFVKHIVDDNFEAANYLAFADFDGDNDQDLLGCAYYDNEIAWWEYSGNMQSLRMSLRDHPEGHQHRTL